MPATLSIRAASPLDLGAIDALLAASYPSLLRKDYPPSTMVLALPRIARANPRLVASGTYYVVERDGAIVGAGGWTRAAPPGGPQRQGRKEGHVRHVVTHHRMTRQGIGRALMRQILGQASAAGVRVMQCMSTRTAQPFYAACGFVDLGPVDISLAPGIDFPAIRMARRL